MNLMNFVAKSLPSFPPLASLISGYSRSSENYCSGVQALDRIN